MTFLPVVERELRVAARRRGTYWGRFLAGLIGAALAAWTLLAMSGADERATGADLFVVVSTVIFLYAAVSGTLVTSDCLSEEKREGTLGLLFLTDLKGYDVVLGKLVATSVNAFYGMLAVVPMLAIPFILGSVSHPQMLRVVLVSINLLLFFLSIGLFASAVCRKDNSALGLSVLIGLVLVLGGPVAYLLKFHFQEAALLSSPAAGCFLAFDDIYTSNPRAWFWINLASTQLLCWFFFMLACRIVPRSWQDAAVKKKLFWSPAAAHGSRAGRNLLAVNPFLWRVARSGYKRAAVWLMLIVLTAMWFKYARWFSFDLQDAWAGLLLLGPAGLIMKAWVAAEASRTLSEDRRSGGLELLLTTPLHERDIVRGQLLALWRQFAMPVGAVLLGCVILDIWERRLDASDLDTLLKLHLAFGGFLVADMFALSQVGMWLGLNNRKPNRAALLSLALIVALPTVAFFLLLSLLAFIPNRYLDGSSVVNAAFTLWVLLGLGADLYFGLTAGAKLRGSFRIVVGEGRVRDRQAKAASHAAPTLLEAR